MSTRKPRIISVARALLGLGTKRSRRRAGKKKPDAAKDPTRFVYCDQFLE